MFDFDAGKIIIVGVIALVFIPPKDLPRVLRQAGQFVGKMRRMANEFQGQFMDAMREADMADLRREAQKLSDAARSSSGLDSLHQLNHDMNGALHRSSAEPVPAYQVGNAVRDADPVMLPSRSDSGAAPHVEDRPGESGRVVVHKPASEAASLAAAARENV